MEITPLTRKIVRIDLKVMLADGAAASIEGISVALVRHRADVDASTLWTPTQFDPVSQVGRILVVGFDADPTDGIVVPSSGADLYARVVDTPELDLGMIERIVYG